MFKFTGESDDGLIFTQLQSPEKCSDHGLPPHPPSVRSKDATFQSTSPGSDKEVFSPTPSSGHYSAGSTPSMSKSSGDRSDSIISRLRREIDQLKRKFSKSERDWAEVRSYGLKCVL